MTSEPTDKAMAVAEKPEISKVALAVGVATVLWAVIAIFIYPSYLKHPLMLFNRIPWAVAGIALTARSLRSSLRWPCGLATWAGGFLIGTPAIIIMAVLSGPTNESTYWVLNIFFTTLFVVLGIFLIRVGFKR